MAAAPARSFTNMSTRISGKAARIYMALKQLAGDGNTVATDYRELIDVARCRRQTVAAGLRELVNAGWITPYKAFKAKSKSYAYQIHEQPEGGPQVADHASAAIVTRGILTGDTNARKYPDSVPHDSYPPRNYRDTNGHRSYLDDDGVGDDEGAFRKMCALLSEFGINEPTRTQLARLLVPKAAEEPEIRRICALTREEWRASAGKIKNPAGLTITRLRSYASGAQIPLPNIPPAPQPQPAPRQAPARSRSRKAAQVEVQPGDEHDQANERARQRLIARSQGVKP